MSSGVFSEWRSLPVSLSELCINTTLRCGQSFRCVSRYFKLLMETTNVDIYLDGTMTLAQMNGDASYEAVFYP